MHRIPAVLTCLALALASTALHAQTQARIQPPHLPNSSAKTAAAPYERSTTTPARPAQVAAQAPAIERKPAPPPSAGSIQPRIDASVVYYQNGPDGAVWARGSNFKFRADGEGLSYYPFLGSSAPKLYPVHFALSAASVGGQKIAVDCATEPVHEGDEVRFDRGAIDEVYRVEPAQTEQRFVIESLPASGELVLHVDVQTELTPSVAADGFEFTNELGGVKYGRATAIDADGRTLELASELEAGAIAIRVPAEFVASARLPIVIDPVIIVFGAESGTATSLQGDISYASGNNMLVTCEMIYSATDHDVFAAIADETGYVLFGGYIDFTVNYWAHPRSAHLTVGDKFLVAAEVGMPTSGTRTIWGVVRDLFASGPSTQFQISDSIDIGDKLNCDVGGDPFPSPPSYFLVVYERVFNAFDRDVLGRLVDSAGNLASGTLYIDNSPATLDTEPVVSKTDDGSVWNIAWQREVSPGDHDVLAARVDWAGGLNAATFPIAASGGWDERHPAVSGPIQGTSRYLVAYEFDFGDHDIILSELDGTSAVIPYYNLSAVESYWIYQDQIEPCVDCNGRHFAVSYCEFSGNYDLFTTEIMPVGSQLTLREWHTPLDVGPSPSRRPQIVSHESGDWNTSSITWFTVWTQQFTAIGGSSDDTDVAGFRGLQGGSWSYFCGSGAISCPCGNPGSSGHGCANSSNPGGGWVWATGESSTAGDTMTIEYGGMPPAKSALLFQGYNSINNGYGNTFGDGVRCVAAPVFRFPVRQTDGTGYTGYGAMFGDPAISLVGGVPFFGGDYLYQVWYRDPAPFCTVANTNLTNCVRVTWTP